jgi:hypothetical protein
VLDNLVNLIKINKINKKTHVFIKINKKTINLLKIMLKIKLIFFVKKINEKSAIIKIKKKFKLKINNFFKKKKITLNSKSKILKNNIIILSNDKGFSIRNKNTKKNGLILFKINF